jgi:hypothetical protein
MKLTGQRLAAPSSRYSASSSYSVCPLCPDRTSGRHAHILAFGALFARHAETLVGSEEDPKDPGAVAKLCYLAGFVYVGFLVFCGMQVCCHLLRPLGRRADQGRWSFIIAIPEEYNYSAGRDWE